MWVEWLRSHALDSLVSKFEFGPFTAWYGLGYRDKERVLGALRKPIDPLENFDRASYSSRTQTAGLVLQRYPIPYYDGRRQVPVRTDAEERVAESLGIPSRRYTRHTCSALSPELERWADALHLLSTSELTADVLTRVFIRLDPTRFDKSLGELAVLYTRFDDVDRALRADLQATKRAAPRKGRRAA